MTVNFDASHSHKVTTEEASTGATGEQEKVNIQNPYIVTYMWKRIS